jgi:hypothetical protein
VKRLLVLVLCISAVSWVGAVAQNTKEAPRKAVPDSTFVPHRDIPKNCRQTLEADGSVLVTCDCEACGKPEARDGLNPLPWSCVTSEQGVICGYGLGNAADTEQRGRSRI